MSKRIHCYSSHRTASLRTALRGMDRDGDWIWRANGRYLAYLIIPVSDVFMGAYPLYVFFFLSAYIHGAFFPCVFCFVLFYHELIVLEILSVGIFWSLDWSCTSPWKSVFLLRALWLYEPGIVYAKFLTCAISDYPVCMNSGFRPPWGPWFWFYSLKRAFLCSMKAILPAMP